MAINTNLLRRPSDRSLFLGAAVMFPLLVLLGYFKSYYFSTFFDAAPLANALVHAHGIIMTLWVVYFVGQVLLIRSKNIKLHKRLGMVGIGLAVLVVVVGMVTAYDAMLERDRGHVARRETKLHSLGVALRPQERQRFHPG